MAIALRGTPQGGTAAANTININVPAGVVNGDLLVAAIVGFGTNVASGAPNDPAGWTKIGNVNTGSGAQGNVSTSWYYRIASGEPASYTFTVTGGDAAIDAGITAYSGVDTAVPFNKTGLSAQGVNTNPTSVDLGSTTVDGCWHIIEFHSYDSSTGSPPAGYTEDLAYDGTQDLVEHKLISPAGATGAQSVTKGGVNGWTAWTAAIQPVQAVVGGGIRLTWGQPGPRYRVPVTGQLPLPFVPAVVVPAGQPLLVPQGVKGPRHSRFPFTGQVPLGGPFQAAAADSATATDGASVQQFPDVGYHPPVLGPRQRWPITGQVPLAGPAVVVSDTASAADGASVVQFPDAGYRPPIPGPRFRIPVLGQVPLTAGGGPVAVSANDTASGADAVTLIGVTDPADVGAGADAVTQVGLNSVDTGAGAEGVSSIGLTGADPGTGADGVGSVGLNTTDAGTGGDGASVVDLGGGAVSVIVRQGVRGPKFFLALRAQVPFGAPSAPLVVGPLEYVQGRRPGATTKDLRPPTVTHDRRPLATVSGQRPPTTTKDRRPDPAKTSQRRAR